MNHENTIPTNIPGRVFGRDLENPLESAVGYLRRIEESIRGVDVEGRAATGTRQGRALWQWAKENGCRLNHGEYTSLIDGGGQEHRVWHDLQKKCYVKATHAGRYGWVATLDYRFNKRTQEDEPYIGMGDALPLEYLERLILQNEVFRDDIRLEGFSIEADGLVILTSQPFVRGRKPKPVEILEVMKVLDFERIPGIPANTEESFSFYRRQDRVSVFDAHTGNYLQTKQGITVPIDLVMVRADEAMHDYLCRRIDAAAAPGK